jgi:flap endonuclease-1
VRYLTITGREFLPSKAISRPLKPELIELASFLGHHTITREQLVDLAIMIGTDFNEGIRGIGPKTALKLVKQHGSLENLPENLRQKLPSDLESLRNIFLHPNVKLDYSTSQQSMDEEGLFNFLCDERGFSRERVKIAVERMKGLSKRRPEIGLGGWLNK